MYADKFKNRPLKQVRGRFRIKNLFDFYKKSNKLFHGGRGMVANCINDKAEGFYIGSLSGDSTAARR